MPSRQLPPLSSQLFDNINSSNNNNDDAANYTYGSRRSHQRHPVASHTGHHSSNHHLGHDSTTHHILQPHSSNQRLHPQHKQHYKKYEADDDEDTEPDKNYHNDEDDEDDDSHHNNNQGDGQHSHSQSHTSENFHLPQLRASSSAASKGDYFSVSRNRDISLPLNPQTAIKLFHDKLSSYELTEIQSYRNIYFVGHNASKRQAVMGTGKNDGFDDDHCSYLHVPHDHIAYRYEVLLNSFWFLSYYKPFFLLSLLSSNII